MKRSSLDYKPYFDHFYKVEQRLVDKIISNCRRITYPKGAIITQEGQVQRDLLFVEEGVQMSYFNRDGKIHVMAFTYPLSISGVPESFSFQQPSKFCLEALTDSRFLAISREDLDSLFDEEQEIERLCRKMTERILEGIIMRHIELHAYTMEERFRIFAKRSPHLFQLVPHKYIANYLKISPTNFSKLYNKIRIG